MRRAAAAILALSLGACVTPLSERRTSDIFQKAVLTNGYGLHCRPGDRAKFHRRLEPLLPWLESQLGREHVARVLSDMEESLATTDFTTCPTRAQRIRSRVQALRLLRHLEARSKRQRGLRLQTPD